VHNLYNVRHEANRHFRNKKKEYLRSKIYELERNSKITNIKDYVEIKCQLDATDEFLLQILGLAQHVSGTIMPIIRSSRVL
jgi:hypothetical protein